MRCTRQGARAERRSCTGSLSGRAGGAQPLGRSPDDARELLRSALPGPVDEQVLDRIVAETHGNPLALLEAPRGFTPTLAGSFGLPVRVCAPESRGEIPSAACPAPISDAGTAAGGRSGTGRGSGAGLAGGRAARDRRRGRGPGRRQQGCSRSTPGCGFVILSCARRSTEQAQQRIGRAHTVRWRRQRIRKSTPIGALARSRGCFRARRGRRRGTRTLGPSGAGPWRNRSGGRVPGASYSADA
jgi:hypothetical protein